MKNQKKKPNQGQRKEIDFRSRLDSLPVVNRQYLDDETARLLRHLEYWVGRIIVESEFIRNQDEGKAGIFRADTEGNKNSKWRFLRRERQLGDTRDNPLLRKQEKELELLDLEIDQLKEGKKKSGLKSFMNVTPVVTSIISLLLSFYTAIFPNKHKPATHMLPQWQEDNFDPEGLGRYLKDLMRYLPRIEMFMRDAIGAIKAGKDPSAIKLVIISFFNEQVEGLENTHAPFKVQFYPLKKVRVELMKFRGELPPEKMSSDLERERQALQKMIQIFAYIP